MTILPLLLFAGSAYSFNGPQIHLAAVIDRMRSTAPSGTKILLTEAHPAGGKADLRIRTGRFDEAMHALAAQSPVRFLRNAAKPHVWYVAWSDGAVPKGGVRLYQQSGSYVLEASDVSIGEIAKAIEDRLFLKARHPLGLAGLDLGKKVKDFKTSARQPGLPDEKPADLVLRLVGELNQADVSPAPSDSKRWTWNLTFLPGNPPSPGESSKIDFGAAGGPNIERQHSREGADRCLRAEGACRPGEVGPTPDVTVSAVGNSSLIIEGKRDVVNEVRRLLATQLDVPQSQILLELDAYQVSADAKGRGAAERSVRTLALAQEIARAYKQAYYQAVKDAIVGLKDGIGRELQGRKSFDLDIRDLFRKVGIDPRADRQLSQTDVLAFLGLQPKQMSGQSVLRCGQTAIPSGLRHGRAANPRTLGRPEGCVRCRGGAAPAGPEQDLSQGKPLLAEGHLEAPSVIPPFSRRLRKGTSGTVEDNITREAIETFLILWSATADPMLYAALAREAPEDAPASRETRQSRGSLF